MAAELQDVEGPSKTSIVPSCSCSTISTSCLMNKYMLQIVLYFELFRLIEQILHY